MSFSAEEIAGMLQEYENEHNTGMDTAEIGRFPETEKHNAGYLVLWMQLSV